MRTKIIDVPLPSSEQVEYYLRAWDELENYHLQEDALDKLFFKLCLENTDMSDILLKVAALNDFYSTNIFSVYPVANHILSLNIDDRLKTGDVTLVSDIQKVTINGVEKNFYSFATKYCSHHNHRSFPIYDSFVDKMLTYFKNRDDFAKNQDDIAKFTKNDLKQFSKFKKIIKAFSRCYDLDDFSLLQIDNYLWLLGKDVEQEKLERKKKKKLEQENSLIVEVD